MLDRDAAPRVLPFAVYLLFIIIGDFLGRAGFSADELRALYGLKIAAVLLLLLYFRRRYGELSGWRPGWKNAVISVLAGVLVLVLWINLNAPWMQIGGSAGFDPRTNGAIDWPLACMRVAGAALVVPVMEELFWRSFLLRWLESPQFMGVAPQQVRGGALLVSSVLFGVEHSLWLAGIVAGLVYACLYRRSQSLWAAIVAHGVTNGLLGVWIIVTGQWTYW